MKKLSVIFLVLFGLFLLIGCDNLFTPTNRVITGVVKCDGEPLAGCLVKVRNMDYETTTLEDGVFSFEILESASVVSEFRLIVTKDGFVQATRDVLPSDFTNNKTNIVIDMNKTTILVSGVVIDTDDNPLEGVEVGLFGTAQSYLTDELGAYSFTISRPLELTLTFSFPGFELQTKTINTTNGNSFFQNVTMSVLKVTATGTIFNYYSGPIAGATVTIVGTSYVTTTNSAGVYFFDDLHLDSPSYNVKIEKEGFFTKTVPNTDADNVELTYDYVSIGELDCPSHTEAYLTKDSTGLYFKFVVDNFRNYSAGKEEKIQVYLNPGDFTEDTRLGAGSHTVEIALTSNSNIVLVVSYLHGSAHFITGILWDTEVAYTRKNVGGKTELYLYVMYSVFGDYIGASFATDADKVIGLGLNYWSDFVAPNLFQWYLDDSLGIDEKPRVFHDNPQDWMRINPDGRFIYEGSNNTIYPQIARTITGSVEDDGGVPISGVTVKLPQLAMTTTTDANGEFSFAIPLNKFGISDFRVEFSKSSFTTKSVRANSFVTGVCTLKVELEDDGGGPLPTLVDLLLYSDFINIGTLGLPNFAVSAKLVADTITLSYVGPSGSFIPSPEEQIQQFFTFSGSKIYEVRFVQNGWTGVYVPSSSSFATWTPKIAHPVINDNGTTVTMSQAIDLTFFSDLGEDISQISMCLQFKDRTPAFQTLKYKSHIMVYSDPFSWLNVKLSPYAKLNLTTTLQGLGTVGADQMEVKAKISGTTLTFTYTYVAGTFIASPEEQVLVAFYFFGSKTYEVRFVSGGWTGIWCFDTNSWPLWTPKIGAPTFATASGKTTATQVLDLSYFSDLGEDISSMLICIREKDDTSAMIGMNYLNTTMQYFVDKNTWLILFT